MTCAQIATMPKNSASDVRAAASSAILRNMTKPPGDIVLAKPKWP